MSEEQTRKAQRPGGQLDHLVSQFAYFLKRHHPNIRPDMLERASSPGYWRVKGGCPGGNDCCHAFRGALGPCDGGGELTIYFAEHGKRDIKGRFVRPYRTWEAWGVLYG